jgi:alpha-ketoglutarate-dependent taurine dioxygenase
MSKLVIPKIKLYKKFKLTKKKDLIKKTFTKYGIVEFPNFPLKKRQIQKFTELFTLTYSNDAARRTNKFKKTKINSVDLGNSRIALHSEASFTYSCPEIIWFYCLKNDNLGSPTTICDGKELWNSLDLFTKKFFLKNPITYDVEIDLHINKKNKPIEPFFVEKIGVYDSCINWKKGKINFKISKFLANTDEISKSLYFANHLLVGTNEPQLKKLHYSNNKTIPKKIIQDVLKKSKLITNFYEWKEGTLLMINNERFMHGRESFDKNSKREILNIQTLKSNFKKI